MTNCLIGSPAPGVSAALLKTHAEALSNFHLHPEAKFLNGNYLDRGPIVRRRIHVVAVRFIGKEANRWEEQFHLGYDPEAQIEYKGGPDAVEQIRDRVRKAAAAFGQRRLARKSGVAREQIRAIINTAAVPRKATVSRLFAAISALTASKYV